MSALAVLPAMPETVSALSRRLAELLEQSESEGFLSQLPDATREQATDLVEALRRRIVRKPECDHRALFDLDDRLIELMGIVEEAAETGGDISTELAQEIDTLSGGLQAQGGSHRRLLAVATINRRHQFQGGGETDSQKEGGRESGCQAEGILVFLYAGARNQEDGR